MNLDIADFEIQPLHTPSVSNAGISFHVARLDKIHPLVSGNKLYKLFYFLELALKKNISTVITYGGPFSNHLLATASACQQLGLKSVGLVRGERSSSDSETLIQCQQLGMQLKFLERDDYKKNANHFEIIADSLVIPEGGYHELGAKGAKLITNHNSFNDATHIFVAVGTATTLAGILQGILPHQQVIAVPVLKGLDDIEQRISYLNGYYSYNNLIITNDYHFGGYAKKSNELFRFMNELYSDTGLPTDFVYTGRMMYATMDMIKQGKINAGANVLCIHTGGLQGNRSLAEGTLIF